MQWDGTEAQGSQQNGYPLGFIYCACEDDSRLASELVEKKDKVESVIVNIKDTKMMKDFF